MDVFKPAVDNSLSPKAASPWKDAEADVFRWPEPDRHHGSGSAQDAEPAVWTAVFDYEATADDELSLRKGDLVEVLSQDSLVSGDEGWWTGMIADRVGIFPSNYVSKRFGVKEEMGLREIEEHPVPPLHREYIHCPYDSAQGWILPCLLLAPRLG